MKCPKCQVDTDETKTECPRCGVILAKVRALPSNEILRDNLDETRPSNDSLLMLALAVPATVLIAYALLTTFPGQLIVRGVALWIHEFGHAFPSWLSGRAATPLPFGWTNIAPTRTLFVSLSFFILVALLFVQGLRHRVPVAVGAAVLFLVLQGLFTFVLSDFTAQSWIIYGGKGAELYLSTGIAILFFYRLTEESGWPYFRFPALLIGVTVFIYSFLDWVEISRGGREIPWGTLFGGQGDAAGDMNRLVDEFDMTPEWIVLSYLQVGYLCIAGFVIQWFVAMGWSMVGRPPGLETNE